MGAAPKPNPTIGPPGPTSLNKALDRNIEALRLRHEKSAQAASFQEKLAETITHFTGSLRFVYLHLAAFGSWIVINLGWIEAIVPWDPSFVMLAMIASVEAIFLSTFVLISQNRMAAENEKRASLDLQINLLAEHEVTRLMSLVSAIADHFQVKCPLPDELKELERDVAPEVVLDAIEERGAI
ncbi:DUF1003 domain-containing protein [Sphingosinicella rhizophila]|uniref:DUF1003 domain-containing protein n=1 Tax=Sphingosinicella rhizophila TaxID=3050082 RepID=A0ABU3QBQ7_9SPHN|nr:DUF1003 domain-containing protein [Sphingosinicella sp. GR2756]MDT9600385.1 DUF1003 domain-containing protein [Sphingosinicella sp. GR2756]